MCSLLIRVQLFANPARLLCAWDSPGKNTEVCLYPFSRGSSRTGRPESEPRFPALRADSLPSEPPGKPQEQMYFSHYSRFGVAGSQDCVCSAVQETHFSKWWYQWAFPPAVDKVSFSPHSFQNLIMSSFAIFANLVGRKLHFNLHLICIN